MNFCEETLIT